METEILDKLKTEEDLDQLLQKDYFSTNNNLGAKTESGVKTDGIFFNSKQENSFPLEAPNICLIKVEDVASFVSLKRSSEEVLFSRNKKVALDIHGDM